MKTKKLTLLLTAAMFLMGADYHERTIALSCPRKS